MKMFALKTLEPFYVTAGHIYDIEKGPITYHPITFESIQSHVIMSCDDGNFRQLKNINNFVDIQQVREQKLNQLGI
jgi:hypothetical protein